MENQRRKFRWSGVTIPGKEVAKAKGFRMDGNGVYQVFDQGQLILPYSYISADGRDS